MAVTTTTDVIVPEVWGDLAADEFIGKAVVFNSPATTTSDQLVGIPGDTIKFPKWNLLNDLDDLTENVPMIPEKLTQTSSEATIKEAGKAVEFTDSADLYGLGSPGDEARRQFGVLAARKVDGDLITAALAAGNLTAPAITGALTWAGIVGGLAMFGDDWDPADFAGLYVRSDQVAQVMIDDQFINAANTPNGNGIIQRGLLGAIAGLNVFVTNRIPTGKAFIARNGSLGALYKRRPIVETDRDILNRSTVVTTNLHYATKRLKDTGVVEYTFN